MKQRREKKSESLEVRLPHSTKQEFMDACEREGITASQAVRTFISVYVRRSRRAKLKTICQDLAMKLIKHPAKTAGISLAALAGALAFTATPSLADDDAFERLDSNTDGYITEADEPIGAVMVEHLGDLDTDSDGKISRAEFQDATSNGNVTVKTMTLGDDHSGFFIGSDDAEFEELLSDPDAEITGSKVMILTGDGTTEDIDLEALLESGDAEKTVIMRRVETRTVDDGEATVSVDGKKIIIETLDENGDPVTIDLDEFEGEDFNWDSEDGNTRIRVRQIIREESTVETIED